MSFWCQSFVVSFTILTGVGKHLQISFFYFHRYNMENETPVSPGLGRGARIPAQRIDYKQYNATGAKLPSAAKTYHRENSYHSTQREHRTWISRRWLCAWLRTCRRWVLRRGRGSTSGGGPAKVWGRGEEKDKEPRKAERGEAAVTERTTGTRVYRGQGGEPTHVPARMIFATWPPGWRRIAVPGE